jgi:Domain of unknown function (DUF4760)
VPATASIGIGWLQFLVDHQLAQPAATVFIGTIATAFAWVAVLTNRWSARMRATLDFLERLETTEHHLKRYRTFRKVRLETNGIYRIIQESRDETETERDLCIDFLNMYEFISLGIRKKILDELYFRQAYEPTIIRDWNAAEPLIAEMRRPADPNAGPGDLSYFEHFEWLVTRWKRPQPWWRKVHGRLRRIWEAVFYP